MEFEDSLGCDIIWAEPGRFRNIFQVFLTSNAPNLKVDESADEWFTWNRFHFYMIQEGLLKVDSIDVCSL